MRRSNINASRDKTHGSACGIADPVYRRVVTEETGYSFSEGIEIYLEDDADANVITVSFGDGGRKVKIAAALLTALTVFLAVKLKKTHRRYKGG